MPSYPLHHQVVVAELDENLGMEKMSIDTKRTDRMFKKRDGLLRDDFQRSTPIMDLPKLPNSVFSVERRRARSSRNIYGNETSVEEEFSTSSVIDDILGVIGGEYNIDEDYEEESESVEDVTIVPVKFDNYERKRRPKSSRPTDKRRRELLLDNASAITEALLAELSNNDDTEDVMLSSGDEESLDPNDIDDGYESDDM